MGGSAGLGRVRPGRAAAAAAARRLQGEKAGALAALLIATQGALVGYYTTAGYNAITAALVIAIVYVFLQYRWTWRCAIGMGLASLLFSTRTNLFPAIPPSSRGPSSGRSVPPSGSWSAC